MSLRDLSDDDRDYWNIVLEEARSLSERPSLRMRLMFWIACTPLAGWLARLLMRKVSRDIQRMSADLSATVHVLTDEQKKQIQARTDKIRLDDIASHQTD